MLARLVVRPRILVQILLIICVGYFLVVNLSGRHAIDLPSTNESIEVDSEVVLEPQVTKQINY